MNDRQSSAPLRVPAGRAGLYEDRRAVVGHHSPRIM
jgi:hypothetical protein